MAVTVTMANSYHCAYYYFYLFISSYSHEKEVGATPRPTVTGTAPVANSCHCIYYYFCSHRS